jgi:polyprenyl-phospho-N-acetylgalactosaminyl synthase
MSCAPLPQAPLPAAAPGVRVPPNTWVVIPAYNEGPVLAEVLERVQAVCPNVVVVDDGSRDETYATAARQPVHLLRHLVNLGQGASLQTGVSYALKQGAQCVVTFDADGQMDEQEIGALCQALAAHQADVVLGSRFLKPGVRMPRLRRAVIRLAVLFTRLTTGLRLSDTHNGFRVLSRAAAERITIKQNRMAHASEILHAIARERLRYVEVPVSIRYTDYSLAKGQSVFNMVNILWDLLFH